MITVLPCVLAKLFNKRINATALVESNPLYGIIDRLDEQHRDVCVCERERERESITKRTNRVLEKDILGQEKHTKTQKKENRVFISPYLVGSSNNIHDGSVNNSVPILTRFLSPPDILDICDC